MWAAKERSHSENITLLGKGADFKGVVTFDGTVRVDGRVEGDADRPSLKRGEGHVDITMHMTRVFCHAPRLTRSRTTVQTGPAGFGGALLRARGQR